MTSTNYTTVADFKTYASIPSSNTTDDAVIGSVVQATFGAINQHCGRRFDTTSETRLFDARDYYCLYVDDVSSATGFTLSTDSAGDGVFETTWASTDYELRPLSGRLNGLTWPYTEVRAVGNQTFPVSVAKTERAMVSIAATWGWPAVPSDVTQAAYLLAMDLFKSKDAPFGVAGTTEFGTVRVKSDVAGMANLLLKPYRKHGVML